MVKTIPNYAAPVSPSKSTETLHGDACLPPLKSRSPILFVWSPSLISLSACREPQPQHCFSFLLTCFASTIQAITATTIAVPPSTLGTTYAAMMPSDGDEFPDPEPGDEVEPGLAFEVGFEVEATKCQQWISTVA